MQEPDLVPVADAMEELPALASSDAAAPVEPLTPRLPAVVMLDGVYHLQFAPAVIVPFLQNETPLRDLGEGWHFHGLFTGFAPVLLFELRHDLGTRATWFFDCTPRFLGNVVENLPAPYRKILLRKTAALLNQVLQPVLGHGPVATPEEVSAFFDISETVRLQLGNHCRDALLAPPEMLLAAELPVTTMMFPRGTAHPPAVITRQTLLSLGGEDFQTQLMTALTDGALSWPSLIDGSLQPVSGGVCFDHFSFAYRMEDPQSGLVYFLLVSEHYARFLGWYIPSEAWVIATDAWSRECIMATFPSLHAMMMSYVCRYGDTLLPAWQSSSPKAIAASMRESHLGHQLWNEFSGLQAIVDEAPADKSPVIMSIDGRANGAFGPLEALFPEFAGKLQTTLHGERAIIEYANRHDLVLARFTRLYVSVGLRDRIVNHMRGNADFLTALAQRQTMPGPVVLVGVRVENRTVVDLDGFLNALVDHIATVAPGSVVLLDGQNRHGNQTPVGSFSDHLATRSPLDVERELCERVIQSAVGKAVTVTTTTGQTIAQSVAWASEATCFISIWGAGLAKYRWLCNKPGLIVSSRFHLLNPREMSIYEGPTFMEAPTPLVYIDPDSVQDDPAAEQLIPVNGDRHVSFHVDRNLFLPQVTAFLGRFLT